MEKTGEKIKQPEALPKTFQRFQFQSWTAHLISMYLTMPSTNKQSTGWKAYNSGSPHRSALAVSHETAQISSK